MKDIATIEAAVSVSVRYLREIKDIKPSEGLTGGNYTFAPTGHLLPPGFDF